MRGCGGYDAGWMAVQIADAPAEKALARQTTDTGATAAEAIKQVFDPMKRAEWVVRCMGER